MLSHSRHWGPSREGPNVWGRFYKPRPSLLWHAVKCLAPRWFLMTLQLSRRGQTLKMTTSFAKQSLLGTSSPSGLESDCLGRRHVSWKATLQASSGSLYLRTNPLRMHGAQCSSDQFHQHFHHRPSALPAWSVDFTMILQKSVALSSIKDSWNLKLWTAHR